MLYRWGLLYALYFMPKVRFADRIRCLFSPKCLLLHSGDYLHGSVRTPCSRNRFPPVRVKLSRRRFFPPPMYLNPVFHIGSTLRLHFTQASCSLRWMFSSFSSFSSSSIRIQERSAIRVSRHSRSSSPRLVLTVLVSFAIPIARLQPAWATVFNGYLPSSTIVGPRALCISVGIIGATVMPHALFLGAKLGRRLEKKESDSHQLCPMRGMAKRRKQAKERLHLHCLQRFRHKAMADRTPQHTCICQIMPNHAISLHMVHATPIPQHPFAKAPGNFQRTVTFVKTHLHHAQLTLPSVCLASLWSRTALS